ncbi:MAG: DUF421 domain-containing protein [Proteobacteria bacterium]|nr:MAG: DUF421 domain-containing protein [Pseudomonadota bacterium]
MTEWLAFDWRSLFSFEVSPIEILLRGSVMYLSLFALLRAVLKRETGSTDISDLLVVVLIADAAQNGMAGQYRSLPDGLLLVGTILFWSHALNWLGYHFPALQQWVHAAPLPLVRDGEMLRRNMRHELITADELHSLLRQQGVEDLAQVKVASMESNGVLSVIRREGDDEPSSHPRRRGPR